MAKRGGQTAMKHARAWVASFYPGAPVLEAQKAVTWIKDKRTDEPRPITRSEDLFGLFDLLALSPRYGPMLVQVTTWHEKGSAASERRTKIAAWLRERFPDGPRYPMGVLVLAYERRKGFRAWQWVWKSKTWRRFWLESPLLVKTKRSRSGGSDGRPGKPDLFSVGELAAPGVDERDAAREGKSLARRGFAPAP